MLSGRPCSSTRGAQRMRTRSNWSIDKPSRRQFAHSMKQGASRSAVGLASTATMPADFASHAAGTSAAPNSLGLSTFERSKGSRSERTRATRSRAGFPPQHVSTKHRVRSRLVRIASARQSIACVVVIMHPFSQRERTGGCESRGGLGGDERKERTNRLSKRAVRRGTDREPAPSPPPNAAQGGDLGCPSRRSRRGHRSRTELIIRPCWLLYQGASSTDSIRAGETAFSGGKTFRPQTVAPPRPATRAWI